MGKKKKNKAKPPRHKQLNRKGRLQAAPRWIEKNLVQSYSNHFGVDKMGAVHELEMLGYSISEKYKRDLQNALIQKHKQKELEKEFIDEESDEIFAFIAGYTSGGAPYGITWEEREQYEKNPNSTKVPDINDEDLPF